MTVAAALTISIAIVQIFSKRGAGFGTGPAYIFTLFCCGLGDEKAEFQKAARFAAFW